MHNLVERYKLPDAGSEREQVGSFASLSRSLWPIRFLTVSRSHLCSCPHSRAQPFLCQNVRVHWLHSRLIRFFCPHPSARVLFPMPLPNMPLPSFPFTLPRKLAAVMTGLGPLPCPGRGTNTTIPRLEPFHSLSSLSYLI
jgi:hypothetical protein